jgi:hypothetical protein
VCADDVVTAEIESLFSVVIDGVVSESLGLKGKPAPDIFTKCAEMLGVHPRESIMVEDATSGVQAGKAGDFGLVVGIDRARGRNRQPLLSAGADVVLDDFSQITSWHLNDFFLPNDAGYVLQFDNYEPKQERLREVSLVVCVVCVCVCVVCVCVCVCVCMVCVVCVFLTTTT